MRTTPPLPLPSSMTSLPTQLGDVLKVMYNAVAREIPPKGLKITFSGYFRQPMPHQGRLYHCGRSPHRG
ncbi:MAG: hypothetical protein IPH04_14185 [Saprospirales bacterium]|nr:hypothetical protein [Saprospirales bacterium]